MAKDLSGLENVIVVNFEEDSHAFDALTCLNELDSQHQVDLKGAAVVVRDEDGQIEEKDETAEAHLIGTASGGMVGLLVGIIGGPFGILIGGATGVLLGSLFDLRDADESESVLADISKSVQVGRTALLADLTEQSTEVIDTAMKHLGGTVLRRWVGDVEAEIAAAEKAQRKARLEARKELLEARHHTHVETVRAKTEELKSKLRPHKTAAATNA